MAKGVGARAGGQTQYNSCCTVLACSVAAAGERKVGWQCAVDDIWANVREPRGGHSGALEEDRAEEPNNVCRARRRGTKTSAPVCQMQVLCSSLTCKGALTQCRLASGRCRGRRAAASWPEARHAGKAVQDGAANPHIAMTPDAQSYLQWVGVAWRKGLTTPRRSGSQLHAMNHVPQRSASAAKRVATHMYQANISWSPSKASPPPPAGHAA